MVTQNEINSNFLDVIRWLKSEYGYTQAYIVEKAELAPNAISKIKNGKANAGDETITKLCNAFNLNSDYFYGRSAYKTKLEEKREKLNENLQQAQRCIQSQPYIDPGSQINAIIAAKDETIDSLKSRIADLQRTIADKEETIATKNAQLADKDSIIEKSEQTVKALQDQIADLRHLLAQKMTKEELSDYPFFIGAAEQSERKHLPK